MAMHHATATIAFVPIGVPTRSPRSVSIIGVNGWCSANQASGPDIELAGTNPDDTNGSSTRKNGVLLAVSTLSAAIPSATDSQLIAIETSTISPSASAHSTGPVVG